MTTPHRDPTQTDGPRNTRTTPNHIPPRRGGSGRGGTRDSWTHLCIMKTNARNMNTHHIPPRRGGSGRGGTQAWWVRCGSGGSEALCPCGRKCTRTSSAQPRTSSHCGDICVLREKREKGRGGGGECACGGVGMGVGTEERGLPEKVDYIIPLWRYLWFLQM